MHPPVSRLSILPYSNQRNEPRFMVVFHDCGKCRLLMAKDHPQSIVVYEKTNTINLSVFSSVIDATSWWWVWWSTTIAKDAYSLHGEGSLCMEVYSRMVKDRPRPDRCVWKTTHYRTTDNIRRHCIVQHVWIPTVSYHSNALLLYRIQYQSTYIVAAIVNKYILWK